MNQLVCFICEFTFPSLSLLRNHVNVSHIVSQHMFFSCKQNNCSRKYRNVICLYNHIKNKHLKQRNSLVNRNDNVIPMEVEVDNEPHIEPQPDVASSDIDQNELGFLMKLYSKLHMTRNDIDHIVNNTRDLIESKFGIGDSFKNLDTEYKRKKVLYEKELLIAPQSVTLDYIQQSNGVQKSVSCQYVPLSSLLSTILGNNDLLETARNYMNTENECLSDLKDGSKFRNLPKDTFPFILFYDELETGNALGSHKGIHKVGCIYLSLRCFPPYFYSSLTNIYTCAVFPSTVRNKIDVLLTKIIDEINMLQSDGLTINSSKIFFKFAGITGDNLGLHQILNFTESFSANFPCRICKIGKEMLRISTTENIALLRNPNNYQVDIETDDLSLTGVRSNCVLNLIDDYHVTSNDIVDLMHDFAEGVANYGMSEIISYYISNDILTLDFINDSIRYFDFGRSSNRPPSLKQQNIQRRNLGLSASEMINLVFSFTIMFGIHIPSSCEVWQYYLTLYDILNIILLKSISLELIDNLQSIIEIHHILYMKLFRSHLKPKHHHLLHYPRLMKMLGPLCYLWSMRFEGKNLECKFISQSCRSRVNLCKSIAERHMLHLASSIYLQKHSSVFGFVQEVGPSIRNTTNHKWIQIKNTKYFINDCVALLDVDYEMPQFARISSIECREGNVHFHLVKIVTVGYNEHLRSYEVLTNNIGVVALPHFHFSGPLKLVYIHEIYYIPNIGI